MSLFSELGKMAARRATARSKSIKVFKPGGGKAINKALHSSPQDARQLPWTYGEKRDRQASST